MTTTQEPLPTFEDEAVDQVQVKITKAGDGLSDALEISPKIYHLGDEFACILRGTVSQVNHKQGSKETVVRIHTVTTTGITEVEIDMAKRILEAAADNLARAKAARDGQLMLEAEEAAAELEAEDAAKDAAIDAAAGDAPTPIFSKGKQGK